MENKNSTETKEKLPSQQIEYQFIPVPRELYYNPEYAALPNDAKHLFILIIDRLRLSERNIERFSDINGKAFVYLTLEEVADKLNISVTSAVKLFDTLVKAHLITKNRQGLGKPNLIQLGSGGAKLIDKTIKTFKNLKSEVSEFENQDFQNLKGNNNNMNNNELNNNQSILYEMAIDDIKEQIDYDIIRADKDIVDEIVQIMYDVMYTQATTVRIGANIYPKSAVCARYRKLSYEEIEDVVEGLETAETPIQNVRGYLISALYNAPTQSAAKNAALFASTYKRKYL